MTYKHMGFTGTRQGMTPAQKKVFERLVWTNPETFHHGDCVGADSDAHDIVVACLETPPLNVLSRTRIVIHPPITETEAHQKLRANKADQYTIEVLPAKPHLERNRDIVDACDVLVATPKTRTKHRSGTWSTITYAKRMGKLVCIIYPDGTFDILREEGP